MNIQDLAQQAAKQARCWKGYEPVPGKPAYSDDSCQPAGSAKKKKKSGEKQAGLKDALSPLLAAITDGGKSVRDRVGETLHGNDEGLDWRWGLAGAPLAKLPATLASSAYAKHVMPRAIGGVEGYADIVQAAKQQGASVESVMPAIRTMRRNSKDLGLKEKPLLKRMADYMRKQQAKNFGHYNPVTETIVTNPHYRSTAILAHELGHHQGGMNLARAGAAGKGLMALGTRGALFSRDEDTSRNSALLGTAGFLPTLVGEVDASRRGMQSMRRAGLKGGARAFSGLPTYLAHASVPMAAHYTKKLFGGFKPSAEKQAAGLKDVNLLPLLAAITYGVKPVRERLGRALHGDDKGLDWRWGLGGTALSRLPVTVAATGYNDHIFPKIIPDNDTGRMALTARTIGHTTPGKALAKAQVLGKGVKEIGTLGALFSRDEDTSRNSALLGTAGALPAVANEIGAARRGMKMMQNQGYKGGARTFGVLPAYLANASLPLAAHYTKKLFGGFRPSEQKQAFDAAAMAEAIPPPPADSDGSLKRLAGLAGSVAGLGAGLAGPGALGAGLGYVAHRGLENRNPAVNDVERKQNRNRRMLVGAGTGVAAGLGAMQLRRLLSRMSKQAKCSCGCATEEECTCSDVEKLAKQAASAAWTRAEGQSDSGGLNAKGRASLKAQGQNIKPPVTESNPKGESAGRKASFCARMGGMKSKLTGAETANDPDSRINKALRKWNC